MKFGRIQMSQSRSKCGHIQLSRPWLKFGEFNRVSSGQNSIVLASTKIWLSWSWPKFGRIRQSRSWPKFGHI